MYFVTCEKNVYIARHSSYSPSVVLFDKKEEQVQLDLQLTNVLSLHVPKCKGDSKDCYGKYAKYGPFKKMLGVLPQCPDEIGARFYLYANDIRKPIDREELDDSDESVLASSHYNITRRTIITCHGWTGKKTSLTRIEYYVLLLYSDRCKKRFQHLSVEDFRRSSNFEDLLICSKITCNMISSSSKTYVIAVVSGKIVRYLSLHLQRTYQLYIYFYRSNTLKCET